VTQAHARSQIKDVIGRDPRLPYPPDHHAAEQLAQMPRVRAV
jgi:hypothetical protein